MDLVMISTGNSILKKCVHDWPVWWSELSLARKMGPALFVVAYLTVLFALHGLRQDHINFCCAILALSYLGRPVQPLLRFCLPLLATGIIYDSQRFYGDYLRGPIHISEPYLFDKTFFGIHTAQGVLTPNEWFQLHTASLLDVITGFMYLFFIAIYVLFAGYFVFYRKLRGAVGLMWGFLWLNLLGYSTYYWYAAAPPWYVSEHGLGPADMSVHANPAGCLRFDAILGTHFFTGMYGRAADVFGAIPSLHVAYPLMAVYFAFRYGEARIFAILFYLLMCFSAVYLNHHYVLDILWGSAYALFVSVVIDWYFLKRPYEINSTSVASSLVQ